MQLVVILVTALEKQSELGEKNRNANDCSRRVSPVAARPPEGLLSRHIAGIRPAQQELVFMPQTRHQLLCSMFGFEKTIRSAQTL